MKFKDRYHTDFSLSLLRKGTRQKAQKRYIEYGTVPDASLSLYEDIGVYDPYERTVELLHKNNVEMSEIYQWLDGSGDLDLGDGGYYKARVIDVTTETEHYNLNWLRIIVTFELQPFLYLDSHTSILTNGQKIYNMGIESYPYFKISGDGEISVLINGVKAFDITVDQYVEIEYPFAWKGVQNKGGHLSEFVKIPVGESIITWTGNVREVKFNGRWRTL